MSKWGIRVLFVLMLLGISVDSAESQAPREIRRKGFELAAYVAASLSFNGVRADEGDPSGTTCSSTAKSCFKHDIGSGPLFQAGIEAPLGRTFGVMLNGSVGRLSRVFCEDAIGCRTSDKLTAVRGSGLLLFRFKPGAPIFFGAGAALNYLTQGPVRPEQTDLAVTEIGGVGLIAYDFALSSSVGARIAWWNYFMVPSSDELGSAFSLPSTAYDAVISFGARIKLLQ